MAKANQKNKKKAKVTTPYIIGAILLVIVSFANMFLTHMMRQSNEQTSMRTSRTMNSINKINTELLTINENVLVICGEFGGDVSPKVENIYISFANIEASIGAFNAIEGRSEFVTKRFNKAVTVIHEYKAVLEDSLTRYREDRASLGNLGEHFEQNIYPLQTAASEMLIATISVANQDAAYDARVNVRTFAITEELMAIVLIAGEIAILLIARYAKKVQIELDERERNLSEIDARLKSTRQKASDLAVMNLLTGMKNRYALDNDIAERLDSDRFNIAVFDMDNFRSINDTYGYDFGDEYLAAVAERIKQEFSNVAEIYNITGNEFCFVFNKDISESQTMRLIPEIQAAISSPYNVLNLSVQLPVSGAVYHYLAGDCLNVNSLLVKLDTAMRNAKMNGGNMVNTVMNI